MAYLSRLRFGAVLQRSPTLLARSKPPSSEEVELQRPVIHRRALDYAHVGSGGIRDVDVGGDASGGRNDFGLSKLSSRHMSEAFKPFKDAIPNRDEVPASNPLQAAGRFVKNMMNGSVAVFRSAASSKERRGVKDKIEEEELNLKAMERTMKMKETAESSSKSRSVFGDPRPKPGARPQEGSFSGAAVSDRRSAILSEQDKGGDRWTDTGVPYSRLGATQSPSGSVSGTVRESVSVGERGGSVTGATVAGRGTERSSNEFGLRGGKTARTSAYVAPSRPGDAARREMGGGKGLFR